MGFLEGSKTVEYVPIHDDDYEICLNYLDHIYDFADAAFPLLNSKNLNDKLAGINNIGKFIRMIA